MSNSRKQDSIKNENIGDPDRLKDPSKWDQDGFENASTLVVRSEDVAMRRANGDGGLMEQLTGIFVEEGYGDLFLYKNGGGFTALRWFQALDFQVMGACRADERLEPLLKLDVSGAAAEDRLLAHLSQHFEASEVGMLASCLCVPLVSIRVGNIEKQGGLLCPTTTKVFDRLDFKKLPLLIFNWKAVQLEGGLRPFHKGFVDDKLRPGLKPHPVAVKLLDLDGNQGHRE